MCKKNCAASDTVQGLLSLLYLTLSSNVLALINYIQISYWLAIAAATASLFYFRWKIPNEPRPIRVNLLIPITFFIGCVALVLIPIIGSPKDTAIGMAIMLSAVPVYLLFIAYRPKFFNSLSGKVDKNLLHNHFQIPLPSSSKTALV